MNKWILFLLLAVWMGGSSWYYVCQIKHQCSPTQTSVVPADTSAWVDAGSRPLYFAFSSLDPKKGDGYQKWIDSIVRLGREGQDLVVTGYYHATESFDRNITDPGMTRAKMIEQLIKRLDMPVKNIVLQSNELDTQIARPPHSSYFDLSWRDKPKTVVMAKDFNKMTIYFTKNTTDILAEDDVQRSLDTFARALEGKVNNVLIEGHTDVSGSAQRNQVLSQERADAVRQLLMRRGIGTKRIKAIGYGDARPQVSNDTESGRAQNRRVQLSVQP